MTAEYVPFPSFDTWADAVDVPGALPAFEELFERARADADADVLTEANRRLTEYAAIETGALEGLYEAGRGFTITVATHGAVLDALHRERGPDVARIVEDQLEAFATVLDLATQRVAVTEALIRQLHQVICRNQRTYTVYTELGPQERELVPGSYKSDPNNPYRSGGELAHAYAPVVDTPPEMARLVIELRSERFTAAPPVVQAAYAHHAFTAVHPFPDGNGRVARTLASIYTYRRPGVPLLVFEDEKADYLQALEAADGGVYQPFVGFIGERIIEAIQLIHEQLKAARLPPADQALTSLARTLRAASGDLDRAEMDALALSVLDAASRVIRDWIASHDLPADFAAVLVDGSPMRTGTPPAGYRALGRRAVGFRLSCSSPAGAQVSVDLRTFIALGKGSMYDFLLQPHALRLKVIDGPPFGFRLSEVRPHLTGAFVLRLQTWIARLIIQAIEELREQAEASLRRQGYTAPDG